MSKTTDIITKIRTMLTESSIVNLLTSTSTTAPLSAAQGKVLQDTKAPIASPTFTGTVTAPIFTGTITGIAPVGGMAVLAYGGMGANDQFRLAISDNGSDLGYVEIATSDNGNDPIFVRQYLGAFETIVRTAELLDSAGNTRFPGTVMANSFTGSLTGIAATATKLSTARTINGVAFDGTANITVYDGTKIGAANYAASTVGGTLKARLNGSILYLTNNGNNA